MMRSFSIEFDLATIRRYWARIDRLMPAPRGVIIERWPLSHCEAEWIRPGVPADRAVVYLPGGAWVLRSPRIHRRIAASIAKAANADVLLVFYRLAPEHRFPNGLEDCIEAYQALLAERISPARIVIGGDSAGGNLTLATLLALRDRKLPQPAGAFALSPCTDMSMRKHDPRMARLSDDPVFPSDGPGKDTDPRPLYVGSNRKQLNHPYCSPIRGDLRGLCRILVQVGSTEWLLPDSTGFVERARAAGVDAELEIWEGQPHVWHALPFPESSQAVAHLSDFVRLCCP